MPRKSQEALDRRRENDKKRELTRTARKRPDKKAAKPLEKFWITLSATKAGTCRIDADNVRAEYTTNVRALLFLAMQLQLADKPAPKKDPTEQSESEESETDSESDSDESDSDDSDDESESDSDDDVQDMSDQLKTHWCVTCLEAKNDVNMLVALKTPIAMKYVLKAREENPTLAYAYTDRAGVRQDPLNVASIKAPWAVIKYLAFGYTSDHDKGIDDVDKTPLFLPGDVTVPSAASAEAIVRFIECYNTSTYEDLQKNPWFNHTSLRWTIKRRAFDDQYRLLTERAKRKAADTTHESRLAKLRRYAEIDTINTEHITNIYKVLKWHNVAPQKYREFILRHFTEDRRNKTKQPAIIGASGSGKGRLSDPLRDLLNCGRIPQSKSAYLWRDLNDKDLDYLHVEEMGKSLKSQVWTEAVMCAMMIDTAELQDPYCTLPANMPILNNNQSTYFGVEDWRSLKRRIDVVELEGGALPEEWDENLEISGAALSYFLFNEDQDHLYDTICIPERPHKRPRGDIPYMGSTREACENGIGG